jgi:hypothetical protein
MMTDARAALAALVAALEAHLAAAEQRRSERDPRVEQAYRDLADAFETYDEVLYDAYDEVTPFVLYDDVEDQREDDDDDIDVDVEDLTDDDDDDLPEVDEDDLDDDGQPSDPRTSETSSRA